MTLDRPTITREELYEAVWAESMVKVAKIYGLSDVGVAKIAKKLHVPVPGRGYWAKGPMERKLLKEALPWARPNVPTSHSFSQAPKPVPLTEEPPILPHLVEAGIVVLQVDTVVAVIAEVDLQVVSPPLVADHLIVRADPVVHEAGDLVEGLAVKNPGDGLVHGGISIMNNQHRLKPRTGRMRSGSRACHPMKPAQSLAYEVAPRLQ